MPMFRPGDRIEFRSGDRGGVWKRGVVACAAHHANGLATGNVRIRVGEGVWIVRPARKCRLATKVGKSA